MVVRSVVFDRDGVLTRPIFGLSGKPLSPLEGEPLDFPEGLACSLQSLVEMGIELYCFSNQPEVSRGRLSKAWLEAQHFQLMSKYPLRDAVYCTHDSTSGCQCRKPQDGLLRILSARHGLHPKTTVVVGDRLSDIASGLKFGARCIFVSHGYDEPQPTRDTPTVTSTAAACSLISDWSKEGNAND